MKVFTSKHKGFTLIELLVVVAIISLLSSIVMASLKGARDKAKFAKIFSTMNSLNTAAFICVEEGNILNTPQTNATGGIAICTGSSTILPNLSDTGFIYCGTTPLCLGQWPSNINSKTYAFAVYANSPRRIVACGSNQNAGTWFADGNAGSPPVGYFNFTGMIGCKRWGF